MTTSPFQILSASLVSIVLAVGCHSSASKPPASAAPAAAEPANAAAANTCQTDADCKPDEVCMHEQVRDDPDNYDPNDQNGPNRPPVMEETASCQPRGK